MTERHERLCERLLALALAAGILGPTLFERGYTLRGDMVFVPDQPWKSAWLGLDGSVPRAVPMDAVVWLFVRRPPPACMQGADIAPFNGE